MAPAKTSGGSRADSRMTAVVFPSLANAAEMFQPRLTVSPPRQSVTGALAWSASTREERRIPTHRRRGHQSRFRRPVQLRRGGVHARGDIAGAAAGGWDDVDVAPVEAEVAHQPFDESHPGAVGAPGRLAELQRRVVEARRRGPRGRDEEEVGRPPVVVPVTVCAGGDEARAVRAPGVLVDEEVCRGKRGVSAPPSALTTRDALLMDDRGDDAGLADTRGQRAPRVRCSLEEQDGEPLPVWRPARVLQVTA